SKGFHGNIVSQVKALGKNYDAVYACGPKLMLKAISELAESTGALCQVSCEARMACGFGVCVGCVVKIKSNGGFAYKKVCKDGPVFNGWEVEWDE
ncbi:MAG: dihydroorotate dehydrogenase electron transfer subunit, partial [Clostridiales bacterium]|nr:dihydroorotate dehydrogenase electron transfer subunit [Clostridiales bacterium]